MNEYFVSGYESDPCVTMDAADYQLQERMSASVDVLTCGCCRGPEDDRCCCWMHQDTSRGLKPHKCSRHG